MCFTVQLSRSVPFPELFVPASAATRSFYHNALCLSRTFFQKFFGFCSPQTDHFWSSLELQEPKPVAFWLLVFSELLYFISVFWLCQELSEINFPDFLRNSVELSSTNGEGGIWTLAPLLTTYSLSRGAPSASLGTSPHLPESFSVFSYFEKIFR